ncbi:hypothetical protein HPB51_022837 [Rhipicephalus microplus]|uniref:Uncharacterized protein n=1 Tax=Rhipicephalus microplus TaxID=6941 RepID=A0A9J6DQX4_RHIMP|nr:hypothetical protein HPB51_022837 [Rhipicephalus microplus]
MASPQSPADRPDSRSEEGEVRSKGFVCEVDSDVAVAGTVTGSDIVAEVLDGEGESADEDDDIRIIIRTREGFNIAWGGSTTIAETISTWAGISPLEQQGDTLCPNIKQNILLASTPKREQANRYVRVKEIRIADETYEVSAYEVAPHSKCKCVIRGIPVQDGSAGIDAKIVNDRNTLALAAKRIGSTTTVIVAFDGHRVPNFVRYG